MFIQAINWIINIGIISIISICFYRLNQITGYAGDDFLYHFLYHGEWPTKHISAIHNVFEWIQSVINQTQMWNGRFIAQGLVQLFMQFPKEIFNIANTIAFIAVGLLINLKFPKINWLNMTQAVKQSMSVFIMVIVDFAICLIPLILGIGFIDKIMQAIPLSLFLTICAIFYLIIGIIATILLAKNGEKLYDRI